MNKLKTITVPEIVMTIIVFGSVSLAHLAGILTPNESTTITLFLNQVVTYVATGVFSVMLASKVVQRNKELRRVRVSEEIKEEVTELRK